ncbi:HAMP domain-containing sensor histidine kinase [Nocardioides sp. GY 10127]|uniref:sensor histidine kinase n=1 Tax=Nocardioides sp. GY 10127 TaxID=2569762 RepID=UPI001457F733|nr:HAMP domain-containing sensor histidine kinase [Nocardioides sp. GY 10127]
MSSGPDAGLGSPASDGGRPGQPEGAAPCPDGCSEEELLFWASLAASSPWPAVVLDPDGVVLAHNGEAGTLLALDRPVLGSRLCDLVRPLRGDAAEVPGWCEDGRPRPGVHDLLLPGGESAAASSPGAAGGLAASSAGAGGSEQERALRVIVSPVPESVGRVVLVGLRDISEERVQAQRADRMRDELLATVSHELRTPLTSILGYAELLSDVESGRLGPRSASMLDVITRNARRELRLVNDLLDVTALEGAVPVGTARAVDVRALLARCAEQLRLAARERGMGLHVDVSGEPVTTGDAQRLEQLVENLVVNGLKFSRPGAVVRLSAHERGSECLLLVEDDGEGIDPADLPHVFERLYRGRNALRSAAQGAGLGLAIARAIAATHGGSIAIESRPGRGTLVTVRLPGYAAARD